MPQEAEQGKFHRTVNGAYVLYHGSRTQDLKRLEARVDPRTGNNRLYVTNNRDVAKLYAVTPNENIEVVAPHFHGKDKHHAWLNEDLDPNARGSVYTVHVRRKIPKRVHLDNVGIQGDLINSLSVKKEQRVRAKSATKNWSTTVGSNPYYRRKVNGKTQLCKNPHYKGPKI